MDDVGALVDAGIGRFERGDFEGAAENFGRAIGLDPKFYLARMNLAACHVRAGRLADAKLQFERAAADSGSDIAPLLAVGRILRDEKAFPAARSWFERALERQPDSLETLHELGALCLHTRDAVRAEGAYRKIRALDSEDIVSLGNLCLALAAGEKFEDVLEELKASDTLVAQHPKLMELGAAAAAKVGNAALAQDYNRKILALDPNDRKALGGLIKESSDAEERRAARFTLLTLLRRTAGDVESWKTLAAASYNEDGYEAVRDVLDEGIARTGDVGLLMTRALTLPKVPLSHAQIAEARTEMDKTLDRVIASGQCIEKPAKSINKLPFHLAYHGQNDRRLQEKIGKAHLAISPHLAWTAPHIGRPRQKGGRLRLGFVSANLIRHSVGRMFGGFIEHLKPDHFEKIILRPPGKVDQFGELLNRSAECAITLPADIAEARRVIADLELDILFYADIGMDPFTYYLAFSRLAPVQMNWPGHPMTSGISTVDYFVTSSLVEAPDHRDHYSEEPILLSRVPTCFPRAPADLPAIGRSALGLPEAARLYVCPMTLYKFHPDLDAIIAGILDRDRDGKLVLIARDSYWYRAMIARMSKSVPDLSGRLITLPWLASQPFLALMKTADVILDTVHVCGANTSLDAFSYGAPIVTRLDRFLRGRLTAAMYAQMGYTDLVAKTDDAYIDLAVRLANDREFRRAASDTILARNNVLYADTKVVAELGERMIACYEESRSKFL